MKKMFLAIITVAMLLSMAMPALAGGMPEDFPEITLSVRKNVEDAYFTDYLVAENGEIVEFELSVTNQGATEVAVWMPLPERLGYLAGSTTLQNDQHTEGVSLISTTVHIETCSPESTTTLRFKAIAFCEDDLIAIINTNSISIDELEDNVFYVSLDVQVVPPPKPPIIGEPESAILELPIIGTACEGKLVERLELATMLASRKGASKCTDAPLHDGMPCVAFFDCHDWAADWAYVQGYMIGDGDGNFRPHDFLTNQELAVVLCSVAGIEPDAAKGNVSGGGIADWAGPSISAVAYHLEGLGWSRPDMDWAGNLFADDPQGFATEELVLEMLDIIMQ